MRSPHPSRLLVGSCRTSSKALPCGILAGFLPPPLGTPQPHPVGRQCAQQAEHHAEWYPQQKALQPDHLLSTFPSPRRVVGQCSCAWFSRPGEVASCFPSPRRVVGQFSFSQVPAIAAQVQLSKPSTGRRPIGKASRSLCRAVASWYDPMRVLKGVCVRCLLWW